MEHTGVLTVSPIYYIAVLFHTISHSHIYHHVSQHPRGQLSRQCDCVTLSSCKAQGPGSFSCQKWQWHHTHSDEITAMDALIALSYHSLDTLRVSGGERECHQKRR